MPPPILSKFGSLRKTGDGWLARCPAHEDSNPSLKIDYDGSKILLHCHRGCSVESICAAKGLTLADLYTEKPIPSYTEKPIQGPPEPATVAKLAAAKGLPEAALRRYGAADISDVSEHDRLLYGINGSAGVWLPYHNTDGSISLRTRVRSTVIAKQGSKWLGTGAAILPYGLGDIQTARDVGSIFLCEGESDFWTLRHAEYPALGIPGANNVRVLQREHLAGIKTAYICQDNDAAGAQFVAGIRQHVKGWGVECYPLAIPAGSKDINDYYRLAPESFGARLVELMQAANMAAQPRVFTTAGDVYTLTVPEHGLRCELDQIRRTPWGDLTGALRIVRDGATISFGNVNLSDVAKRHAYVKDLGKRSGLTEVDWPKLIDDFAARSLDAQRVDAESTDLRQAAPMTAESSWRVAPGFLLAQQWPSCLFGDGGTGKSYIALQIAGTLARQGVNVLYVDGEFDASVHRTRLERLFGAELPAVRYLRITKPLSLMADQVKREVVAHRVAYIIVDSIGVLTQGSPEEAESALGYVRALHQIGVGSLSIAHVTKNGELAPSQQKPFGSVFYHNSFRRCYFAKRDEEPTGESTELVVWNTKVNEGKQQQPFGLRLTFGPERTTIEGIEAASVDGLAGSLSTWQRIRHELRKGPKTAGAVAEALGINEPTVKRALQRRRGSVFVLLPGDAWALAENREN